MNRLSRFRVFVPFLLLIVLVPLTSSVSVQVWSEKEESSPHSQPLLLDPGMTVAEFGQRNALPRPVLREVFGLTSPADLQKHLDEFGLSSQQLRQRVEKERVLAAEEGAKNWRKIVLKFLLWFAFLAAVFVALRRRRVNGVVRKGLYLAAVAVFGVLLGSDPAPMGTVKDAIVLYGASRVVFPQRLVAMLVFLGSVVLANKWICAWGCQAGALQDLVFRLNRNAKDSAGLLRQYKPPFVFSNAVRVGFFAIFTGVALCWGVDLIHPIDPFKVFKPAALGLFGGGAVLVLSVLSLFVYRPWCQFFCPFGLVGWLLEKVSWVKIQVDYQACVACGACERACPSSVMGSILRRDRTIPDCFSCGTCIEVCPAAAVEFRVGKRERPPVGKFLPLPRE